MENQYNSKPQKDVDRGEYPFPLTKGPEESPYLTWLRNHSNYMAERGVLDYLRLAGVLVRGVLLNFLIVLSLLLFTSVLIGYLYGNVMLSLIFPSSQLVFLAEKLEADEKRPIDEWLRSNLSDQTITERIVAAGQPNPQASAEIRKTELQMALSNDLARIIDGPAIYDAGRFEGVELSEKTKYLVSANMADFEHDGLNRSLLDDAYPNPDPNSHAQDSLGTWLAMPKMPKPFSLTLGVVVIFLLWIAFSPIWVAFTEIAGQRKSRETDSIGTLRGRDLFERTFGLALLLILAFALFESLPMLVGQFHRIRASAPSDWNNIFAAAAGVSVAVMASAGKVLSLLGGAKKKLAMLFIFLLGILAPLLVVLYVTEFLVYGEPYSGRFSVVIILVVPIVFALGASLAIVVGIFGSIKKINFKFNELIGLFVLGGVTVFFSIVVFLMISAISLMFAFLVFVQFSESPFWNHSLIAILGIELYVFCWLVLDVNQTSIHGLYRDRLSSAYLLGIDTAGTVDIEEDINLADLACTNAGSTAPYHLINATLNLQGSRDISIRDRKSSFFIFSKRFIGSKNTGYCRTETMEQVHPQMSLSTAMAISAGAASPNMGQGTSPALVAIMVLLNVRMGYWLPNPGRLEENLSGTTRRQIKEKKTLGYTFETVFAEEIDDIDRRRKNTYVDDSEPSERNLYHGDDGKRFLLPTTKHGLVGIGFSGGGIRSATINLGITQALNERGIFRHIDYMSTVSGGGYLGSSISTLMRRKNDIPNCRRGVSEIDGTVKVKQDDPDKEKIVAVIGDSERRYQFSKFDKLQVKDGAPIKAGDPLIGRSNKYWDRFRWRVSPMALLHEILMKIDETHRWVNVSDGGHIENMAAIELLRRRCKIIIIGDGEADPGMSFRGLATLIRFARIDLGIDIQTSTDAIRINKTLRAVNQGKDNLSKKHCVFGMIRYPRDKDHPEEEWGYLLYLKSSFTGDEDEVIKEYKNRNRDFPHESTADQFFDEDQFECYRALGQHIGEKALEELNLAVPDYEIEVKKEPRSSMVTCDELLKNIREGAIAAVKDAKAICKHEAQKDAK